MAGGPINTSTALSAVAVAASTPLEFVVVGVGASSGGLDAIGKVLDSLPADSGMAYIIVQHLDPTHESLLVELLKHHTKMPVVEAREGMSIAINHVYIIPPGRYLTVSPGTLHLSSPTEKHGARLPFDFTLKTLAKAYGPNAVCVVLSGNGADGSEGLKAVADNGGLVIAQTPDEAAYTGMPMSAIATGQVDLTLVLSDIGEALIKYQVQMAETDGPQYAAVDKGPPVYLDAIVALLREKTPHDYTLYKAGTLQRRIDRRMTLASLPLNDMKAYLDILAANDAEVVQLAKDLLIHVTGFFRDSSTFALLSETVIPDLVRAHPPGQPIRVWSVGCSTGEEAYSLAIIFREALTKAGRDNKLQVFASDADPDSIATAREGIYPAAIEASVPVERLDQFFSKEDGGYRVSPNLRACVVFTVQDLLADPPFSRLDFVSCRNLLIYLGAEAQAKAISLFHFALRDGGLLLLGSSETPGATVGRFEVVSKSERVFRHVGRSRPGDFGFSQTAWQGVRTHEQGFAALAPQAMSSFSELCRQWTLDSYAPAIVLLNDRNECLFTLGPVSRYLTIPEGHPTVDVLAMASDSIRPGLRSAVQQSTRKMKAHGEGREPPEPIKTSASYNNDRGEKIATNIEVRAAKNKGVLFLLVGFVDSPVNAAHWRDRQDVAADSHSHELEIELETTRTELESVLRNFERSHEEHKAINEEASSVNEEYQSANEELLTSKEELQSLNEELTALNSQLQETLDRQRTTASDLQNVLYSTNVATLFLDRELNIRFFTPTTRSIFKIIATDIGRPLSDLHSLALDAELEMDADRVLKDKVSVDREIETSTGLWFLRRVMPYLTEDRGADGVVITFTDITERNRVAADLRTAKQQADLANIAKTRFLSAASHDLRQPLQSLALLQGLLANAVDDDAAQKLVTRLDETIEAMSGMLNTLLDINQFESGMVRVDKAKVPVNDVFERLKGEFQYHAEARHLKFRVVPTSRMVFTDPALLEQLIRNLLSNAIKYTQNGGVLMGCRPRGRSISIEVWDSGIGISSADQKLIFDEYYQVDNAARQRSRGLGLGLSIVQRLADVLDHTVSVRSRSAMGTVFSIRVDSADATSIDGVRPCRTKESKKNEGRLTAAILVVEDDPQVRELLQILLEDEGHRVATASDGESALALVEDGNFKPDVLVADYNLPNQMNGLDVARAFASHQRVLRKVVILTGDISAATLRDIDAFDCFRMSKPVKPDTLLETIQDVLGCDKLASRELGILTHIYVIDDDRRIRGELTSVLEGHGYSVTSFGDGENFFAGYDPERQACILIDAGLPGMSGLDVLKTLRDAGHQLPAIMITGDSDVAMAVDSMKAGATDFLEKPVRPSELLASIKRAVGVSIDSGALHMWQSTAARTLGDLTARQRQIMHMVLAGHPNKNIAADLGISQRTVENHRASIMAKTGAKSLPALARLALAASTLHQVI